MKWMVFDNENECNNEENDNAMKANKCVIK
jgi:hypothetical protein